MSDAGKRVLVCSNRSRVVADLRREFASLRVPISIAESKEQWLEQQVSLMILDLADEAQPVREARLLFDANTELVALVDNESVQRLVPALAAGCADYLFYPVNQAELRLCWRRHVHGEERVRSDLFGEVTGHIQLEFPSSVRYVRDVVDEVVEACERLAFSGTRATLNLRVALGEAVANAILYGNGEDPDKRVQVQAELSSGQARITVSDEGPGFDPEAILDPTLPENRQKSHGRGLFLLRSLTDELRFNEPGNAVTLVLRGGR